MRQRASPARREAMLRLTLKERIFYGLICNEGRVYQH